MDPRHIRFPSIEAFRAVCHNVEHQAKYLGKDEQGNACFDETRKQPKIPFKGTVKLHGTNVGVGWNGEELWTQSRTRIITPKSDNANFAVFVEAKKEFFLKLMEDLIEGHGLKEFEGLVVYGEWCGKGVQRGVAINQLDRMFVIFRVKLVTLGEDENIWLSFDHNNLPVTPELAKERIFFIDQFPTFELEIDFENPGESLEALQDLTMKVEAECPVAKSFGVSGVGEGIVWSGEYQGQTHIFKVKGEKHSSSKSREKKLVTVDPEKMESVEHFVEYAVTESRLEQAVHEVILSEGEEIHKRHLGNLIAWVRSDVLKEEWDTLMESGLQPKDVVGSINKRTVSWFTKKYGL